MKKITLLVLGLLICFSTVSQAGPSYEWQAIKSIALSGERADPSISTIRGWIRQW